MEELTIPIGKNEGKMLMQIKHKYRLKTMKQTVTKVLNGFREHEKEELEEISEADKKHLSKFLKALKPSDYLTEEQAKAVFAKR